MRQYLKEELTSAASCSLHISGKKNAAKIVKEVANNLQFDKKIILHIIYAVEEINRGNIKRREREIKRNLGEVSMLQNKFQQNLIIISSYFAYTEDIRRKSYIYFLYNFFCKID